MNKNKLKGYRQMCKLTQEQMAERMKMPLVTYTYKENKGDFNSLEIKLILDIFNDSGLKIKFEDLF